MLKLNSGFCLIKFQASKVEESLILFVKSEKIEQVAWSMPHHDHGCSASYRAIKTEFVLGEEDKKAIEALKKTGLRYNVVDLGLASATIRIKAKTKGINTTPTLIYKGQKFKGLRQIVEMLTATVNMQQK